MRIVMICTGNTCRSPMAEAFMREALKLRSIEAEVCSAGVSARDGYPASEEAVRVMREYGLDIRAHRSRAARPEMLDGALVLCMTRGHRRALQSIAPRAMAYTLGEYARMEEDIEDPYGCGLGDYRACAARIRRVVEAAAERIAQGGGEIPTI